MQAVTARRDSRRRTRAAVVNRWKDLSMDTLVIEAIASALVALFAAASLITGLTVFVAFFAHLARRYWAQS